MAFEFCVEGQDLLVLFGARKVLVLKGLFQFPNAGCYYSYLIGLNIRLLEIQIYCYDAYFAIDTRQRVRNCFSL